MQTLTEQDYIKAAESLGCEVAVIKAVAEVEAPKGGFDANGKLTFLFEPHVFWKRLKLISIDPLKLLATPFPTDVKFRVLSPVWNKKLYPSTLEDKYNQLDYAKSIHYLAAIESCSWGKFQIMGYNYEALGYINARQMVDALAESEKSQLDDFVDYIKFNHLDDELRAKAWKQFAAAYNGPRYYENNYHIKLQNAYLKHSK